MIGEVALSGHVDIQYLDTSDVWQSLTPEATGATIRRGGVRAGLSTKTDVGLCTFTLHNSEDPMDGGSLQPGMSVRVMSLEGDLSPIFTGRIAHLNSVYPMDKSSGVSRSSVLVTVADAVQVHTSTPRNGVTVASPFYETFEARIGRLEGSANAAVEVPVVGAPREVYAF
jgi:hypothetical protein